MKWTLLFAMLVWMSAQAAPADEMRVENVGLTLIDKAEKKLAVNWEDELVKATCLTKDGTVIHPNFAAKA